MKLSTPTYPGGPAMAEVVGLPLGLGEKKPHHKLVKSSKLWALAPAEDDLGDFVGLSAVLVQNLMCF